MMGNHRNDTKRPEPKPKTEKKIPPAGPHDKPELKGPEKYPALAFFQRKICPKSKGLLAKLSRDGPDPRTTAADHHPYIASVSIRP
jgi:hypothetical protein